MGATRECLRGLAAGFFLPLPKELFPKLRSEFLSGSPELRFDACMHFLEECLYAGCTPSSLLALEIFETRGTFWTLGRREDIHEASPRSPTLLSFQHA